MHTQLEPPSERNCEIYHDVAAGMSQRQAADKYELSQPMISKIVRQYKQWIVAAAPDEEFNSAQADYLAIDAWCETLERGKELACEAYEKSCLPRKAPVVDDRPIRWYPAKPEMRCLKQMIECAEKFVIASQAREKARRELRDRRDGNPKYQAEQSEMERTIRQRHFAGHIQRDVGAREKRQVSLAEALAILARPDLVCQLTSALTGVPPVPPEIRALSEPAKGDDPAPPEPAPEVIKPGAVPEKSAEKPRAERLSPSTGDNRPKGKQPATSSIQMMRPRQNSSPAAPSADLRHQQTVGRRTG
jgi:hypothetical protein